RETVDIRGIGLYSLGSFRKNLNDEQRKEYEKIFEEYFLESFSSRLAEYSNPEIEVVSKKKINENYTMVNSTLIATDARAAINIGWRVYTKNPENLLIRDLIIEGLSLVRTQKEEFESIINSNEGKIEVLFQNLSNFNNKQ
ncbi:ABC transporter substrate-binding protein, partial [Candidatus Pelagibacter sp.]|nr:ABC transporter substrate-binding protein [Candidatus Pelagibacter sp.]